MAIEVREMRVAAEEGLLLEESLLQKAHLGQQVRIVIQKGEIRLLPVEENWIEFLNDLAGCLGEEPVQDYDFKLKSGKFVGLCCGNPLSWPCRTGDRAGVR